MKRTWRKTYRSGIKTIEFYKSEWRNSPGPLPGACPEGFAPLTIVRYHAGASRLTLPQAAALARSNPST